MLLCLFLGLAIQSCSVWTFNYIDVSGKKVNIHAKSKSWRDAASICFAECGELLRVDSKELHNYIYTWAEENGEGFVWADGIGHHGNLTWKNGDAIDGYSKDNIGILGPFNDSCVSANDKWRKLSVKSCSIKQSFACQLRDLTLKGFDTTSVPGRAVRYLYLYMTWYDAKSYCNNLECGGHLLTVNNGAANRWIMGRSRTWIGLNDLGGDSDEGYFKWESGRLYDSSQRLFNSGEPNDGANNYMEDCIEANIVSGAYNWNDYSCDDRKPFACEIWLQG